MIPKIGDTIKVKRNPIETFMGVKVNDPILKVVDDHTDLAGEYSLICAHENKFYGISLSNVKEIIN